MSAVQVEENQEVAERNTKNNKHQMHKWKEKTRPKTTTNLSMLWKEEITSNTCVSGKCVGKPRKTQMPSQNFSACFFQVGKTNFAHAEERRGKHTHVSGKQENKAGKTTKTQMPNQKISACFSQVGKTNFVHAEKQENKVWKTSKTQTPSKKSQHVFPGGKQTLCMWRKEGIKYTW